TGIDEPSRIRASNLGLMFAVKPGGHVQVINLKNSSNVTQIKDKLKSAQDVAVDDYDRVYIWDSSQEKVFVFSR
ncbi:MAG: hypothetical protein ACYTFT_12225, partial [Planctomycetota bacterium]